VKYFILVLGLVVPSLVLATSDASLAADAKPAKRDVVVPNDTTPFSVQRNQAVRITGEGIGGGKITAKVSGPATILTENVVSHVQDGHLLIGADYRDFEIRPTGKGRVTVTITVTPPQPDSEPTVTIYQFRVK